MDPTRRPFAAFAVRTMEWCELIPQALPVWDHVLRRQPARRDPNLLIPY
jgi:hypothetical protein